MKAETVIGPGSVAARPERTYVGIRVETPFDGMFAVITKELKGLRQWVKTKGLAEEGPYFVRYYHCDMKQIMKVEVGFVTKTPHPADGRVKPGVLPKGKYATLVYRGNGLRGNIALMDWARQNNVVFEAEDPTLNESYVCRYEAYLTDYRVESRKLLWDIELSIKVKE